MVSVWEDPAAPFLAGFPIFLFPSGEYQAVMVGITIRPYSGYKKA